MKLVPVRNRKKRRRSEQRKIEKRTLSLSVLTILRFWVGLYKPLLQDIYLISNKGEEF